MGTTFQGRSGGDAHGIGVFGTTPRPSDRRRRDRRQRAREPHARLVRGAGRERQRPELHDRGQPRPRHEQHRDRRDRVRGDGARPDRRPGARRRRPRQRGLERRQLRQPGLRLRPERRRDLRRRGPRRARRGQRRARREHRDRDGERARRPLDPKHHHAQQRGLRRNRDRDRDRRLRPQARAAPRTARSSTTRSSTRRGRSCWSSSTPAATRSRTTSSSQAGPTTSSRTPTPRTSTTWSTRTSTTRTTATRTARGSGRRMTTATSRRWQARSGVDRHAVWADPGFADPSGHDYHVDGTSPVVDAGLLTATSGSTDLDGTPRAQGASIDIGAYEVAPPPPSPTPSIAEPVTYAGELPFLHTTNGWGDPEVDHSNGERAPDDGGPIRIGTSTFEHGIGAHAPSKIVLDLGGRCSTFLADVGVDEEVGERGLGGVRGRRRREGSREQRAGAREPGVGAPGRRRHRAVVREPRRDRRRRRQRERSRRLGRRPPRLFGLRVAFRGGRGPRVARGPRGGAVRDRDGSVGSSSAWRSALSILAMPSTGSARAPVLPTSGALFGAYVQPGSHTGPIARSAR